ncbi:hypothetical protein, partial [Pedobacter alluvionis]|uniref:hypothetical protein n=1 Tax=Pedobacter alluvionis TaxID=475253 RepID=UPI00141A7886
MHTDQQGFDSCVHLFLSVVKHKTDKPECLLQKVAGAIQAYLSTQTPIDEVEDLVLVGGILTDGLKVFNHRCTQIN